jgi:hypothetical protein
VARALWAAACARRCVGCLDLRIRSGRTVTGGHGKIRRGEGQIDKASTRERRHEAEARCGRSDVTWFDQHWHTHDEMAETDGGCGCSLALTSAHSVGCRWGMGDESLVSELNARTTLTPQMGINPIIHMQLAFKFQGKSTHSLAFEASGDLWDRTHATHFQGKCHVHCTTGATLYY